MSEERMVEIVETALQELGVPESVVAAGQFMPRGHTGSMFAGGMLGDSVAGSLGGVADSVATVGGALAGAHLHDASSGLPSSMLVGVTATHVCGFAAKSRSSPAGPLVFRVPRAGIEVKVHQRVNVRILELIDTGTGSRIELEGNRIPLTHSKDVIEALQG
ncbi:MAG TPA: hypothetical protein PK324_22045 [Nocardioides sp.]|uniref:hypothetical protein n=1 Tax=uncultured Nocardioides sp. TaxID=198441 RepID=UPI00260C33ED|nr:hypothetical protein [uncultured Nocardioides sp.]HRD62469.1 hypothetical protein [Nocardioides sp.]HRK48327.1 hypothetical protein [Nocardioides sp.]